MKNPDGSTDNLVFDVHKYLDEDNSGTHTECVKDNIDDTFQPLVDFLKQEDRVAMLTETGGGNVDSCSQFLCAQMDFIDVSGRSFIAMLGSILAKIAIAGQFRSNYWSYNIRCWWV